MALAWEPATAGASTRRNADRNYCSVSLAMAEEMQRHFCEFHKAVMLRLPLAWLVVAWASFVTRQPEDEGQLDGVGDDRREAQEEEHRERVPLEHPGRAPEDAADGGPGGEPALHTAVKPAQRGKNLRRETQALEEGEGLLKRNHVKELIKDLETDYYERYEFEDLQKM